jgi:hypothetical protein
MGICYISIGRVAHSVNRPTFVPEIEINQKAIQSLIPQKKPIDRYSRSVKRARNLTKSALASTGFWSLHPPGCTIANSRSQIAKPLAAALCEREPNSLIRLCERRPKIGLVRVDHICYLLFLICYSESQQAADERELVPTGLRRVPPD